MRVAKALIVTLIVLFCTTNLSAQEITGKIEGRILDDVGNAVAFANVVVSGPSLQGNRGVMSTVDGDFGLFRLPAGPYSITISHVSYQTLVIENVIVYLGTTTALNDIGLKTKVYETPEVIVSARRPLVDATSTAIGANLLKEDIEALPLERDYRKVTTLLPQSNQSFFGDEVNFSGATGLENRYFIDGVDVTDPYRGVTGTSLPYNFIKETEVRSGGYEAEYRSSLGGVVNAVSYSGSDEFHGQLFGFFANNNFAGDPRFGSLEPRTGDFAQYDVGFGVQGPIKKEKLWFYAAYNPRYQTEDVEVPGTDYYTDESLSHIFAGKLTWKASEKSNVALTVFGDPGSRESVGETFFMVSPGTPVTFENADPVLGDQKTGGINAALSGNYFVNDNLILDASLSVISRQDYLQPLTERGREQARFIDLETGTVSDGFASRVDNKSLQVTAEASGTVILGDHMLKAGAAYRDNKLDIDFKHYEISRVSDTFYSDIQWLIDGTVHNRIPSVFVQDSWRIHDRLRLNAGIRWDKEFLVGSDGKVAQEINSEFQPRLGFVYQPGEIGSQKIFGSYSRFYQEASLYLSSLYHVEGATIIFTQCPQDPREDTTGCESFELSSEIAEEVPDLVGQHYDEFTLGYERQIGNHYKLGARGVYQALRQGIEDAEIEPGTGEFAYGNPGEGQLADYPKMDREYMALEFTAECAGNERYGFLMSYVLSKNRGNYPGLFNSDYKLAFPNANASFDLFEMLADANGLLPNDRTHSFKMAGSYNFTFGFSVGTSFIWQSGTPLSEFVGSSAGLPWFNHAVQRGTVGRTDQIWDLNFRFVQNLAVLTGKAWRTRLIMDVFHLGSQRTPVDYDQVREWAPDAPNPTYGQATRYQPPTTVRLGLEVGF
jgi:hypothetical protein